MKLREVKILLIIFLISVLMFFPTLNLFFTHDDFFHLKISSPKNIFEFLKYFDLFSPAVTNSSYRPLSTQLFFFIGKSVFASDPLGMRVVLMLLFTAVNYLVYKISDLLLQNKKAALLAVFFYATSSTHFGRLAFLSTQEIWFALFFLLTIYFSINYITSKSAKPYFGLVVSFILSLMTKETAIVLPATMLLVYVFLYLSQGKEKVVNIKTAIISFIPISLLSLIYLYFHVFVYGLQTGDSYIWDFSPRVINTLFWYGLWSVNIPEMLVDFIGPGLSVNIGPLVYWSRYLLTTITLAGIFLALVLYSVIRVKKSSLTTTIKVFTFGSLWFVGTLSPVVFLPWHKFSFYLTIPLVGVVLAISYILTNSKIGKPVISLILASWLIGSFANILLLERTSWISQGGKTAKKVYNLLNSKYSYTSKHSILFYDEAEDAGLTWSPTDQLKTVLSNKNFFEVYFPQMTVYYQDPGNKDMERIHSRQFFEY